MKCFTYTEMKTGQEQLVSDMVWEVFEEFVAPGYSPEGIETFRCFIHVNELKKATESGKFFTICCWDEETLAGSITIRDGNHISLLFVKKDYHQQGIAKELFNKALKKCHELKPDFTEITVNSSPYAVDIYKRLGFSEVGEQTTQNGITYIPMNMKIKENAYEDGEIEFKENNLTVEDFQELRTAVGWFKAHPLLAERSVNGTLYSACAYAEGKTVGMARVIGDGGMTLYVQDVIVHPKYQGQGIGKKLMEFVMNYIRSSAPEGSILQVSLMASKGKEAFYERFGFISRPNEKQGAGMQQRICIGKAVE